MATEIQADSLERRDQQQSDKCLIKGERLTESEFTDILNETIPPEIEQIITYRENVLQSIQTADRAWNTFQGQKNQKNYKSRETALKTTITQQFTDMVTLKTTFENFCTQKITQLDNEYRYIRKTLLKKSADPKKKIELEKMCAMLVETKAMFQDLKSEGSSTYKDAVELLRNKNDTRKLQLMEDYPSSRYTNEDIKKARDRVKNGNPRSPQNALKYLGGSPTGDDDYGKCEITNRLIENNKSILKNLQKKARERSKKRKNILRWNPKDPEIEIPDLSSDLIEADAYIKNIISYLKNSGINTDLLTAVK